MAARELIKQRPMMLGSDPFTLALPHLYERAFPADHPYGNIRPPGAELDAAQVAEQDATQGAEQDRLLPEFPGPSAGRSWNWNGPTPTRRRNGGTRRY